MLSAEHRAIVKATVPLLESGGVALTTHFYDTMMREYPEVRPLFNQTHQATGAQARALAHGVLMYARHIDRLDQLGDLVSQIVNKHVSLNILPEHYPIVGTCLLRAIREVLGTDIATDDVIAAWGAAYGQLADILIGLEESHYVRNAAAPGGWRGARRLRVTRKERESDEITSFYLSPEDGGTLLGFNPGQYLGLRLDIDGEEVRRNYSLSAAPDARHYRISVKREPNGKVSNFLHDRVEEGDVIEAYPPAGDFALDGGDKPLALISGGVGITPTLAMLQAALDASKRPVHFIHAARHGGVHAFRKPLEELAARHPQLRVFYCYEKPRPQDPAPDAVGRIDQSLLARWLPATSDIEAYFLGPVGFMRGIRQALQGLGVPAAQCHYEFFGPAGALE